MIFSLGFKAVSGFNTLNLMVEIQEELLDAMFLLSQSWLMKFVVRQDNLNSREQVGTFDFMSEQMSDTQCELKHVCSSVAVYALSIVHVHCDLVYVLMCCDKFPYRTIV